MLWKWMRERRMSVLAILMISKIIEPVRKKYQLELDRRNEDSKQIFYEPQLLLLNPPPNRVL